MKKLIEKILFKYGFVPIREVRMAEIKVNVQWKKIILDKNMLRFEQMVAQGEKDLVRGIMTSFYFTNGITHTMRVMRTGGIKRYVISKKP